MSLWLIDLGFSLVMIAIGSAAGWWLRGRPATRRSPVDFRSKAATALQELQRVADDVHSCIQEHTTCIQAIEAELSDTTASEPAVLTAAVDSLRAANQQVCDDFSDICDTLDDQTEAIDLALDSGSTLMLTWLSLDRQKHQYQKVLESLQLLASEVASDVDGCGQELEQITSEFDDQPQHASDVTSAIAKMLDATTAVEERITSAEKQIEEQAERVQMQAVLGHADLVTSLPNRRAFDAELARRIDEFRQDRRPFVVAILDVDHFKRINDGYGRVGGDVVLRGIGAVIKNDLRGEDMVARYGGEEFAVLLSDTTLAKALPVLERLRNSIQAEQFTHGCSELSVTVSVGTSQVLRGEEDRILFLRAQHALSAAKANGGNATYWHDGREAYPVHALYRKPADARPVSQPALAQSLSDQQDSSPVNPTPPKKKNGARRVQLSNRSMFTNNVKRRVEEFQRGGYTLSVILVRVDQYADLLRRYGPQSRDFLLGVMGRLLEASTRSMDERAEYDDKVFALLLPGGDQATARRVAERLREQIAQCKLRFKDDLWELSATIGTAHCKEGLSAMDLLLQAEEALETAGKLGGNMLCVSD